MKAWQKFQKDVLNIAQLQFSPKNFHEEVPVCIGNPPREHKFDVVSDDKSIIIECKCFNWRHSKRTRGYQIPQAKISILNEAVLFLSNVSQNIKTQKILAIKEVTNPDTKEHLAEYYVKHYCHLLSGVEVWEVNLKMNSMTKLK